MTARHELDQMCRETWNEFGHGLKTTSNSMGRVGLSFARRHPALLLGGGALLGFGGVLLLTRGKKHAHAQAAKIGTHQVDRPERSEPKEHSSNASKLSKPAQFATGAAVRILKSAARMWLLEHLSSQVRGGQPTEESPSDLEAATESTT